MNDRWENLQHLVNGDKAKAKEIALLFINETPLILERIKAHLQKSEWAHAAELVHKVKSRFGYLGEAELTDQLTECEVRLKTEKNVSFDNELEVVKELENRTSSMITELKNNSEIAGVPTQKGKPLVGKTVLVAEDDEINALVFELFVKELGGEVIKVVDGNQAVMATFEKKPDLIFMDVHMPFFSGLEAIRTIRAKGIQCPIISLSASTRLNERQNSLDAGANEFLVKPAKRENINNLLAKYLS